MMMRRREGFDAVCAGYRTAGWSIHTLSLPEPPSGCFICGDLQKLIVAFARAPDGDAARIANVNVSCLESLPTSVANENVNPYDKLRGFAIICKGYVMCGQSVSYKMYEVMESRQCFVCGEYSVDVVVRTGIYETTCFHKTCIGPFIQEKNRCERKLIGRAWLLAPLGDCRIVIAHFLLGAQNVYEDMFP
jgi:hypothetical protein